MLGSDPPVPPTTGDTADLDLMLEELGRDHEAMRVRILELLRLLEEAVDAQVRTEHLLADMTEHAHRLEAELDAMRAIRLFRVTAPLRAVYGRVRTRWHR